MYLQDKILIEKLFYKKIEIEATCIKNVLKASIGKTYKCYALTFHDGTFDKSVLKVGMITDRGEEECFRLFDENFIWKITKKD